MLRSAAPPLMIWRASEHHPHSLVIRIECCAISLDKACCTLNDPIFPQGETPLMMRRASTKSGLWAHEIPQLEVGCLLIETGHHR